MLYERACVASARAVGTTSEVLRMESKGAMQAATASEDAPPPLAGGGAGGAVDAQSLPMRLLFEPADSGDEGNGDRWVVAALAQ